MNRTILSQRISSILDDIQRLNSALFAMNTTDIQRYPDNYETLSTDAALRAEQIACTSSTPPPTFRRRNTSRPPP